MRLEVGGALRFRLEASHWGLRIADFGRHGQQARAGQESLAFGVSGSASLSFVVRGKAHAVFMKLTADG